MQISGTCLRDIEDMTQACLMSCPRGGGGAQRSCLIETYEAKQIHTCKKITYAATVHPMIKLTRGKAGISGILEYAFRELLALGLVP